MKILIVNDDSVTAPGIAVLAKAAAALGEVWVVAPAQQCSAMSQKLTIQGAMKLEETAFPVTVKAAYSLDGTPVDCVKVALQFLMEEKPDVVLSGINNGYNVGYDIAYSGTLGAAFEAARNGIPAIALSTAGNKHLSAAEDCLTDILRELMLTAPEPGKVWNVNFPAGQARGILRQRPVANVSLYRETYIETCHADGSRTLECRGIPTPDEQISQGSDAWAVRNGYISIGQVTCTVMEHLPGRERGESLGCLP